MPSSDRYMTARQAASILGISLPTLYSYVSRGMLQSEPVTGKPRLRRYLRDDVLRLVERKELRSNPARVAEKSLHWGSPVLQSSLTLIDGGRLFYRGHDVIDLADRSTLEQVAALLWTGDTKQAPALFADDAAKPPPIATSLFKMIRRLEPVERCQLILPFTACSDLAAHDLRPAAVAKTGARILRLLLSAVVGFPAAPPMERALARAWALNQQTVAPALRAALILCADHELNVSAFTARCVASARATPYEAILGALAAFRGRRHGGASEEVQMLFRDAQKTPDSRQLLAARLRSFGFVPGFGHQLYPAGDPRAQKLIGIAKTHGRPTEVELAKRLIQASHALTGGYPNLDFGLVMFARALRLPLEAPIAIFALGRTVGWIAHAIEQYADNQLIRPRARYVGPTRA
ncbi:MAG TPA: citrate synthase family protein [Candidatus Acidoferrum sp.]|nr:citrate synthase family protein [Candidatus Acidoferrum sp.]